MAACPDGASDLHFGLGQFIRNALLYRLSAEESAVLARAREPNLFHRSLGLTGNGRRLGGAGAAGAQGEERDADRRVPMGAAGP